MHINSHQRHIWRRMRCGMCSVLSFAAAATAALAWLAASPPAEAQSFDCTRARTPDERAICADPLLSVLDEIMTDFYRRLRDYTGRFDNAMGLQAQLVNEARDFLKKRERCGRDRACLEKAYRARIRQLLAWWAKAMADGDGSTDEFPATTKLPDAVRAGKRPGVSLEKGDICKTLGLEQIPEVKKVCPDLETLADYIETWPLSQSTVACALPCTAGAYNVRYRVLLLDPEIPNNAVFLSFATVGTNGKEQHMEEIVNPEYDPANRTLRAFDRARGLGDCGIKWTWHWDGGVFELKEQREKMRCDGKPGPWKRLWPRRQ